MKSKVKENVPRIKTILAEHEVIDARGIAKRTHLSTSSVYKAIRKIRESGIGVYSSPIGYKLSIDAKMKDDVRELRRINGRRASDYIAINAAKKDILRRWKGIDSPVRPIIDSLLPRRESLFDKNLLGEYIDL